MGLWYPKDTFFNLVGYSYVDYAGCRVDRESTLGSCQFLSQRLMSWYNKKQKVVSTSTVEAEYIDVGSCCAQVLWIRNHLRDYGIVLKMISIMCDNTSAILIVANPVDHPRTMQIDIRYHFIREHALKGTIILHYIPTTNNWLISNPIEEAPFNRLVSEIGMLNSSS